MKKLLNILVLLTVLVSGSSAQILKPVKWEITPKKVSEGIYDITCKATIDDTWHLYDTQLPDGGPVSTTFNVDTDETSGIELVGAFQATTRPLVEHSTTFDMDLRYFTKTATLTQRIKVTKPTGKLVGYIEFMACSGGQCIPPAEADFEFELSK